MLKIVSSVMAVDIGKVFKINNSQGIGEATAYQSIGGFVSAILPNIYVVAGLILFFLFLGGGFAIIASSDNPEQKGKGAKAVTAAVIGFLIIFLSYWIIQIIEKITGVKIFQPEGGI